MRQRRRQRRRCPLPSATRRQLRLAPGRCAARRTASGGAVADDVAGIGVQLAPTAHQHAAALRRSAVARHRVA